MDKWKIKMMVMMMMTSCNCSTPSNISTNGVYLYICGYIKNIPTSSIILFESELAKIFDT